MGLETRETREGKERKVYGQADKKEKEDGNWKLAEPTMDIIRT